MLKYFRNFGRLATSINSSKSSSLNINAKSFDSNSESIFSNLHEIRKLIQRFVSTTTLSFFIAIPFRSDYFNFFLNFFWSRNISNFLSFSSHL